MAIIDLSRDIAERFPDEPDFAQFDPVETTGKPVGILEFVLNRPEVFVLPDDTETLDFLRWFDARAPFEGRPNPHFNRRPTGSYDRYLLTHHGHSTPADVVVRSAMHVARDAEPNQQPYFEGTAYSLISLTQATDAPLLAEKHEYRRHLMSIASIVHDDMVGYPQPLNTEELAVLFGLPDSS